MGMTEVRTGIKVRIDEHDEVLSFIRMIMDSGEVSDFSGISFTVDDTDISKIVTLARYLEDHNVGVYAPGSVLFFDSEVVMLLVGFFVMLFPDYVKRLNERGFDANDEVLLSYYETCIDFASGVIRGGTRKPLADFIERTSKVHHKLYMATDYGFSGLFYRLLEFEPFSSLLKKGDSREVRDMAVFSRILADFEKSQGMLVLEPETYGKQVEELFNGLLGILYRNGTGKYEALNTMELKGCVSINIADMGMGNEASAKRDGKVLSLFEDIDVYSGCSLRYYLLKKCGFIPSRTMISQRDELVIRSIRSINDIVYEFEAFPFKKDAVSEVLEMVERDMGSVGKTDDKYFNSALKQVMKFLGGQEKLYIVTEPRVAESLEYGGYTIEGSFTAIETPLGDEIALLLLPGKLPGKDEVFRKLTLLKVLASQFEERTDAWMSNLMIFFAGEDKSDPLIVSDSDDNLEEEGMKIIEEAVSGITGNIHDTLSTDRELCLACDFRFHCKRTHIRKDKK